MRRALLLVAGLVLGAAPAAADEYHFEDFRFGRRALTMGGAVVAWPGEPETVYYNPAGLVHLGGVRFSGSLHYYGFDRRTLSGALREGAEFPPLDARNRELVITPSSSVTSMRPFGPRHAFALASFVTSATDERFGVRQTFESETPEEDGFRFAEVAGQRDRYDRLALTGVGYAYRLSDAWSIGATAFYARHDRRNRISRTLVLREMATDEVGEFIEITTSDALRDGSLFVRLGALWLPEAPYSAGVSCALPSVPLHGTAERRYTLKVAVYDEASAGVVPLYLDLSDRSAEASTVLPLRCRGGVSWRVSDSLRLNLDASVIAPLNYERLSPQSYEGDDPFLTGVWPTKSQAEFTVNGMLGVEWWAGRRTPVRAGVFTNRTSAPEVPVESREYGPPHLDLYGVTTGVGYVGDGYAINVGAEFQGGIGHDRTPRNLDAAIAVPVYDRIERRQWRLLFFVSGAVAFAKSTAKDVIRDLRKPDEMAP